MKPLQHLIILVTLTLFNQPASADHHAQDNASERAVLITGASSGLGLKMTQLLSQNGFVVYAGARKEADLKRLNAMENVESVKLDVTIQSEIDDAVTFVQSRGRGLYGLINNAGVAVFGPMTEVPIEQLEYQIDINVFGPYRVLHAFTPMIIESKGRIATTGSIAGIIASPMFGPYAISKHAIEAFTDSLAAEMERFGVQVGVIEPGNHASKIGEKTKKLILSTNYWSEDTRYKAERAGLLKGLDNVSAGADPLPVAEAALDFMQSEQPKRRYMVVPNEPQAQATIRKNLTKMVQLNQAQTYEYDRATLIKMLNEELDKLEAKSDAQVKG